MRVIVRAHAVLVCDISYTTKPFGQTLVVSILNALRPLGTTADDQVLNFEFSCDARNAFDASDLVS